MVGNCVLGLAPFGGGRGVIAGPPPGYCEEIRVFKAGVCLDRLAWNNGMVRWLERRLIGTVGGIGIWQSEVKF